MLHVKQRDERGEGEITNEEGDGIAVHHFYEACYNYFEDVRMGRDESYSKGWMDALQKVINIAGMDMNCITSFSYAITAVMDEAECDDVAGYEKLGYEIVALATKAMEKAAKGGFSDDGF